MSKLNKTLKFLSILAKYATPFVPNKAKTYTTIGAGVLDGFSSFGKSDNQNIDQLLKENTVLKTRLSEGEKFVQKLQETILIKENTIKSLLNEIKEFKIKEEQMLDVIIQQEELLKKKG